MQFLVLSPTLHKWSLLVVCVPSFAKFVICSFEGLSCRVAGLSYFWSVFYNRLTISFLDPCQSSPTFEKHLNKSSAAVIIFTQAGYSCTLLVCFCDLHVSTCSCSLLGFGADQFGRRFAFHSISVHSFLCLCILYTTCCRFGSSCMRRTATW